MKFSPISNRIIFLVIIQISLIVVSVLILTNFESQNTLLGNSINVASHNIQLVDEVLFEMEKYRIGEPFIGKPTLALSNLNDNINVLKDGGNIGGLEVDLLPKKFNTIWNELRTEYLNFASTSKQISNIKDSGEMITELDILFLEDSMQEVSDKSTLLANELTKYSEERSQTLISLQIILAVVNIVAHIILIILIIRTLREEINQKLKIEKELKEIRTKKAEEVLYDTIPSPVVTFNQNNKLVDCNQYFLEKIGFSKDELMRMQAPDFLSEKDQKLFRDVIMPALNEGTSLMDLELHIKKKNGGIFHSIWSHIAIRDDNNEYIGFTGVGLDLTEIDKLRDELIEKEKMTALLELKEVRAKKTEEVLYEVIPDFVITLDKNNRIEKCNKKILDTFGFSKDDLLGKLQKSQEIRQ